jgi:HNH endonuclease
VKEIELIGGGLAIVDDSDYVTLSAHVWRRAVLNGGRNIYARTCLKRSWVFMHVMLLGSEPGKFIDHENRNGLDNRRQNLRFLTRAQNNMNSGTRPLRLWNDTGYKGVMRTKAGTFRATLGCKKGNFNLGTYPTPELAAQAYNKAALEAHGSAAYLNPV